MNACEAVALGLHAIRRSAWAGQAGTHFYDLLRRSGSAEPVFYVFDLLWLAGQDLRPFPLLERKRLLRPIIPEQPSVLLHAGHIDRNDIEFLRLTCEPDLEGTVAKLEHGIRRGWFKIRKQNYSQREGRNCSRESENVLALGPTIT